MFAIHHGQSQPRWLPGTGALVGAGCLWLILGAAVAVGANEEANPCWGLEASHIEQLLVSHERPPHPEHGAHKAPHSQGKASQWSEVPAAAASKPPAAPRPAEHSRSGWDDRHQELSVEPGLAPLLPSDAPAWISTSLDLNAHVHRLPVGGPIAEDEAHAARDMDEALLAAVRRYIDEHIAHRRGAAASMPQVTADFIWKNLVDEPQGYVARLTTTSLPMYQKWVLISITPEQRDIMEQWGRQALQRQRLAPLGAGTLGVLGCVGMAHLLLSFRRHPRKQSA